MRFADAIVVGKEPIRFPDVYVLSGGVKNTAENKKALREAIADAMPLEATPICRYAIENQTRPWVPALKEFPQVLPWKNTFLSMNVEHQENTEIAVLARRSEIPGALIDWTEKMPKPESTVWAVDVTFFLRQAGLAIPFGERTLHLQRSDGTPICLTPREYYAPGPEFENLFTAGMATLCLAGVFANCQNVRIDRVNNPKVTDDMFKRKHGRPQVVYHTIVIEQGKHGLTGSEHASSELERALHSCRGHFRRYGHSGRGKLFGKFTGTFWIEEHLRGNSDAGQSIANYAFPDKP